MAESRFEFDDTDFADESITGVKDEAKRQFVEAGLDDEQAEYNAQFLASGLSTFARRAGMSSEELYRNLGIRIVRGEITGEANIYTQPAYHGGAVKDITEFSTDFIGTGEGAQSYGWGLYAGGVRDTGESYRKNIAVYPEIKKLPFNEDRTPNRAGQAAEYLFFGTDAAKFLKAIEPSWSEEKIAETCLEGQKLLDEAYKAGQLYRVDIPEDGVLLDWGKPISEQPENVKAIIESLTTPEITRHINELKYLLKHLPGNDGDIPTAGDIFYNALSMASGSEKAASLALKEAGVPGHRYLDQLSRDKGEGTHNYVIYDGGDMKIRETYYQASAPLEILNDFSERTMQAISSANTSLNQVPASFKSINWEPGSSNADIGGGRFDTGSEYYSSKNISHINELFLINYSCVQ
jgi:hypothetical protein